jgi:hypothetical protein
MNGKNANEVLTIVAFAWANTALLQADASKEEERLVRVDTAVPASFILQ